MMHSGWLGCLVLLLVLVVVGVGVLVVVVVAVTVVAVVHDWLMLDSVNKGKGQTAVVKSTICNMLIFSLLRERSIFI